MKPLAYCLRCAQMVGQLGKRNLLGDETGQGRRTLGVIDGTLTQVAMAALLLAP